MLDVAIEDLHSVIDAVLVATFGVTAREAVLPPKGPFMSALVGIAGQWNGAVIVGCSPALVARFACSMFGLPEDELGREHLEDTMGELANMVGGNLKSMIPPSNKLSLPTVVEGRDYRVRVPNASVVHDISLDIDGEPMRVTVLERVSQSD
jgi:chemotaxis protein CheX